MILPRLFPGHGTAQRRAFGRRKTVQMYLYLPAVIRIMSTKRMIKIRYRASRLQITSARIVMCIPSTARQCRCLLTTTKLSTRAISTRSQRQGLVLPRQHKQKALCNSFPFAFPILTREARFVELLYHDTTPYAMRKQRPVPLEEVLLDKNRAPCPFLPNTLHLYLF